MAYLEQLPSIFHRNGYKATFRTTRRDTRCGVGQWIKPSSPYVMSPRARLRSARVPVAVRTTILRLPCRTWNPPFIRLALSKTDTIILLSPLMKQETIASDRLLGTDLIWAQWPFQRSRWRRRSIDMMPETRVARDACT